MYFAGPYTLVRDAASGRQLHAQCSYWGYVSRMLHMGRAAVHPLEEIEG